MTPEQCQKHRWISRFRRPSNGRKELDKANLRQYVIRQRWHAAIDTVKALKRMGAHLTSDHSESGQALTRSRSNSTFSATEKSLLSSLNYSKSSNEIENLVEPILKVNQLEPLMEIDNMHEKARLSTLTENLTSPKSEAMADFSSPCSAQKNDTAINSVEVEAKSSSPHSFYIITDDSLVSCRTDFNCVEHNDFISNSKQGNAQLNAHETSDRSSLNVTESCNVLNTTESALGVSLFASKVDSNALTFPTPTKKDISVPCVTASEDQHAPLAPSKPPRWTTKTLGPTLASRAAKWLSQPEVKTHEIVPPTYTESLLVNQILSHFKDIQSHTSVYSSLTTKRHKTPRTLIMNKPVIHFRKGVPVNTGAVTEMKKFFK